ncbi:MAG: MFS transporter [Boseongicola sp.]|nr:MAG: MFS transporter [Boseongicola sp.]
MPLKSFLQQNARFLSAGVLLTFSSAYGQTFFIALFAAQIMGAYDLTDGQWGGLYTVATTASAIIMFWAGTLTDKYRAVTLVKFVMPGLALVCVAMAYNQWVFGLAVIIFFLRFLGQGMMSQLATVSMARWFVARRGLALSVAAMGFAIGQALLPVIIAALFVVVDWRTIWIFSAFTVLATFPFILKLLESERTPQSLDQDASSVGMMGRHWTRAEVLKSPIFWMFLPMLLGPPAWGTSLFFQQVHIAEVKGWPLLDYLALIPLLTVVAVTSTLISGQLIDRFGSGKLIVFYMFPWIFGFLLLAQAQSLFTAAIAFTVLGSGVGLQSTLVTAFWAEYFGTRHIGSIKAVSASIMVFGSAIGPGITGGLIDIGYSFPSQMPLISGYFALAAILVWAASHRAARKLASA